MKMNQRGDVATGFTIGFILLVVVFIVVGIGFSIYAATNRHEETFTVNKLERVQDRDGQGAKYLVYTDNGVYENTDSLLNGKFDSADMYNNLKEGKKYNCTVVGFRVPFFSMFENIIECKEA